jgi:hypothetical protein
MMQFSGRQTQFYIDVVYGLVFTVGFGYLLFVGMDPRIVAFEGGLVLGYFLRVWENMTVYERVLEDEVAAEAEDAVAEEVEQRVPAEAEAQVEAEVEDQVQEEVEAEVTDRMQGEVEDQVQAEVEDQVPDEVANELVAQVSEIDADLAAELEAHLEETGVPEEEVRRGSGGQQS